MSKAMWIGAAVAAVALLIPVGWTLFGSESQVESGPPGDTEDDPAAPSWDSPPEDIASLLEPPEPAQDEDEPEDPAPAEPPAATAALSPERPYPTLGAYERAIGEPGVQVPGDAVWLFAPARAEAEGRTVFAYLVRLYGVLQQVVGQATDYPVVVYHLPENHPDLAGESDPGSLFFGYGALALANQEEWIGYNVPRLTDYAVALARQFVYATRAQFGGDSLAWSLGMRAALEVAPNPVTQRAYEAALAERIQVFQRYRALGNVFPPDLDPSLVDGIFAAFLFECEQAYGPAFWTDAFREIGAARPALLEAGALPEAQIRDARYRITVDCLDRLPGLRFKERLSAYGISAGTDVKSLNPESPRWDRRLQ